MKTLIGIATELWGMFVDDGTLAVAIVAWVVLAGLGLPYLPIPAGWDGTILFAGLLLILVDNIRRSTAGK